MTKINAIRLHFNFKFNADKIALSHLCAFTTSGFTGHRVQTTTFFFLYPVSVRFPTPVGYRSHFLFSRTRFPSDFLLRSGTDHTFPSPVPDRLLFFATLRVQEALFSLLYPYHFGLSQQIHFEELHSCRLDYPCPFFLAFLWKCHPLHTSNYIDRAKRVSRFTVSHLHTPHLPP